LIAVCGRKVKIMKKMISPSMMCADIFSLGETLDVFEKNGVSYLHIDIMDGEFVPNFTLGTDYCRIMKKATSIPLDIHLMVNDPEKKLSWFEFGEGDIVSVHFESTKHPYLALQMIRERGAKAFLAINPGTAASVILPMLSVMDGVLVMTVNPGFAGQKLAESTLAKITEVRMLVEKAGREDLLIETDGNVSFENAVRMSRAGADIFVAGTSSIFRKDMTLAEGLKKLNECIEVTK
jgi:ribulose-phosphate 3-epimerase